jgi:Zn-dependent M28 family amino/carboxypeptidase
MIGRWYAWFKRGRFAMKMTITRKEIHYSLILWSSIFGALAMGGFWMLAMPGCSHKGSLPPMTAGETKLEGRLREHVMMLAESIGERNTMSYSALRKAAEYLAGQFAASGYQVMEQTYLANNKQVSNIWVEIKGGVHPEEIVVIGAHYDSPQRSPGADDNASGAAAMLELARLFRDGKPARTVRFVAFVNEEPPFFQTELMGSRVFAAEAAKKGEKIVAMLALESIGYYSDAPGSQQYPFPLSVLYPDTGNFIGFVGNFDSRSLLRRCIGAFRDTTRFPSEGVLAPQLITGIGWSDHWSFWQEGYLGLMVTDTAPYRNPHYHEPTDTPDRLDYGRMARVVSGLRQVLREVSK